MKRILFSLAIGALLVAGYSTSAEAAGFGRFGNHGSSPWHGNYYDPQWAGIPHALVVPPTVHRQIKYGWGASGTELRRIPHQYGPSTGGEVFGGGGGFLPQPVQPTHTDQFGTYYIRGPRK
jgi:hypothetical protein